MRGSRTHSPSAVLLLATLGAVDSPPVLLLATLATLGAHSPGPRTLVAGLGGVKHCLLVHWRGVVNVGGYAVTRPCWVVEFELLRGCVGVRAITGEVGDEQTCGGWDPTDVLR
jgi:hypothetical protein